MSKRAPQPTQSKPSSSASSTELDESELSKVTGGAGRQIIDCEGYAALTGQLLSAAKRSPRLDGVVVLSSSLPGG